MKLHELKPVKGSKKNKKLLGRGIGSGLGKTSGRGHKGQKSRSGASIPAYFEGGQMPISRRLPKVGFTNIFKKKFAVINLDTLAGHSLEGEISAKILVEKGVIRKNLPLKVLGRGEVEKPFTVNAVKFSKTAKEKIEKAGGKVVVVETW